MRELSRERQDIIQMRTQAKCRFAALVSGHKPPKKTLNRIKRQIALFDEQLAQIEADMERLRQKDEQLSQSVSLLCSISHIGTTTAFIIIAETNDFQLFENRNQLIKYAGLDVIERQSGSSIMGKSKISKRATDTCEQHLIWALFPWGKLTVFFDRLI